MSTIASINPLPNDVLLTIFSYQEPEDLGRDERVCKKWQKVSNDDVLWKALYQRVFKQTPPQDISAKKSFIKKFGLPVKDLNELQNIVTSFFCTLKWDKKRCLECNFLNEPTWSLAVEQSFGPNRGTSDGFKGPADEMEYYRFTGEPYPGDDFPWMRSNYRTTFTWNSSDTIGGIPIESVIVAKNNFNKATDRLYFKAEINGTRVDEGNTLAVYSAINHWKQPFTLTRIEDKDSTIKWVGWIPFSEFKFVKIDKQGKISYETYLDKDQNRYITLGEVSEPQWSLQNHLEKYPIIFPE